MNNNIINSAAVTTMASQVGSISPSSRANGAAEASSAAGNIQTLRPVDPIENGGKKDTQAQKLSAEDTKQLVDELNEYMDDLQTHLGFSIREDMDHQVVVKITNRKTGELLKQIPSEELLKIRQRMEELTGFLFDQSV